jgi:hypothetical protein
MLIIEYRSMEKDALHNYSEAFTTFCFDMNGVFQFALQLSFETFFILQIFIELRSRCAQKCLHIFI